MKRQEFEAALKALVASAKEAKDSTGCIACEKCVSCIDCTFCEQSERLVRSHYCRASADLIDCSTGQTLKGDRPVYGRLWQTPFSDRIRNEVGIATVAVGAISDADQANSVIAAGRADLVAVARPHLADPAWTLHEAARIGVPGLAWPKQYLSGRSQYEAALARAGQGA